MILEGGIGADRLRHTSDRRCESCVILFADIRKSFDSYIELERNSLFISVDNIDYIETGFRILESSGILK